MKAEDMLPVVAKMVGASRGDMGMCYWLDGAEWNPLKYSECALHLASVFGIIVDLSGMVNPFPVCCASWGDEKVYHEEEASHSVDMVAINNAIVKCVYKILGYQNDCQTTH